MVSGDYFEFEPISDFSFIFPLGSYTFFLGDLNFRINQLTPTQVYDSILIAQSKGEADQNRWTQLLQYDQVGA